MFSPAWFAECSTWQNQRLWMATRPSINQGGAYSKIQIVSVNWGLQVNRRWKQKRPELLNAVNILKVKRTKQKFETENKWWVKGAEDTDFEEVRESSYGHN